MEHKQIKQSNSEDKGEKIMYNSFADAYNQLIRTMRLCDVDLSPRGEDLAYEIIGANILFDVNDISIYSHKYTKAFPIQFALAEFLWMLSGSTNISILSKFNKSISHYVEESGYMPQAYGYRLYTQWKYALDKLKKDQHTRQACMIIYDKIDSTDAYINKPCNVFLQFMIRNNELNLFVTSRSSDFLTGLPIDAFHWQFLLILFYNELKYAYPTLRLGYIDYKINSLHVYKKDEHIINSDELEFHCIDDEPFEYNLTYTYTSFTMLREAARAYFNCCKIFDDIMRIYLFEHENVNKINMLQHIFKTRKHKVIR